jgi:hypothetical protein
LIVNWNTRGDRSTWSRCFTHQIPWCADPLHHLAHTAQAEEVQPVMVHQHCKFGSLIAHFLRSVHVLTMLDGCVFVNLGRSASWSECCWRSSPPLEACGRSFLTQRASSCTLEHPSIQNQNLGTEMTRYFCLVFVLSDDETQSINFKFSVLCHHRHLYMI